jgi:hypothetical protein
MPKSAWSKSGNAWKPPARPPKDNHAPLAGWALGLGLLAAGCGGYRLGPTLTDLPPGRSVQVHYLVNQTLEPRIVEAVNQALRRNLQQDGTYRLHTHGDADVLLTGVILRFDRLPVTFQPRDVVTVQDYELRLVARVKAVERVSGKVLLEREVTGRTTLRAGNDPNSAERQAIPLLAEDFARNTTTFLVEGAW